VNEFRKRVRRERSAGGFTLIELMTVVAIVAILVAIALPSYHDSVRKGKRGQAKADLVELAQRAERYRTINGTYAGMVDETWADEDAQSPKEGDKAYTIARDNDDAVGDTFVLSATPEGGQQGDTRCMTLTIDNAGNKTESGSGELADCW
jgi:type IV pilus assembly protein PilE